MRKGGFIPEDWGESSSIRLSLSKTPLHRTFISGFAWTSITKWLTQVITWASVFYAARLLSPADFGMVEMAGFVAIIAQVLAEFGLGGAVVQMRQIGKRELGQLHTVSLGFGLLAAGVSYAAAPFMADFFHQPELKALVMWYGLGFVVMSIQVIPQGLMQRELDYRGISLIEAGQAVVQAALLVACARAGYQYWSFLVAATAGRVLAAGLAWYWYPVHFDWPRLAEIRAALRFGVDVSLARLSGSLLLQSDGFVIGRVLGNVPLGTYRLAINLASAPAEKVAQLVMRVTGPLFASLQDDRPQLSRYFLALSDVLMIVLAPITVGFVVTAPELVAVALGPKWGATVEPARWLVVYMSLRSLVTLGQQVLIACGRTRYFMWTSLLSFAVLLPVFYVAASYGLWAIAAGWLVTAPLLLVPQQIKALRLIGCSVWAYVRLMVPSLSAAGVMGLAVWMLQQALPGHWSNWMRLGCEVSLGGAVYSGLIWSIHKKNVRRYREILNRN